MHEQLKTSTGFGTSERAGRTDTVGAGACGAAWMDGGKGKISGTEQEGIVLKRRAGDHRSPDT